jgi:hypothetical protein
MVDYAIEICQDMKVEKLYAIMLPDNYRAIKLMKKMGFSVEYLDDGTAKANLDLGEEEKLECPETPIQNVPSVEGHPKMGEQKAQPETQTKKPKELVSV